MIGAVMLFVGLVLLAYIATTPGDQHIAGGLGGFLIGQGLVHLAIAHLAAGDSE